MANVTVCSCRILRRVGAGGLFLGLLTSAAANVAGAADPPLEPFTVGHIPPEGAVPTVDGKVDEDVWKQVEPYSTFTQQDPVAGAPATERTEVRILLDRKTIYVGVICFDSEPGKIVVSQSRRDSDLTDSDSIQILFDTFNDDQNAFIFGTSPLGIEYDGQVAGEGQTGGFSQGAGGGGSQRGAISGYNGNWDGDWRVKAQTTDRGWEAEMAIPLKTLRFNSGTDKTWGFNVMRIIRRKNEQVYLAPIERGYTIHQVSQAAMLTGLDLPTRRDIKGIPYVATKFNWDYVRPADQLDRSADVGFDLKWGVKPNLTADFTVNTDFAQVEADEEQINLTRFPLFFPEKRSFFLENASVFTFGSPQNIDIFFTRRIGLSQSGVPIDILAGGRLSGKIGKYNVGILNMQTRETFSPVIANQLIAPSNNFAVLRAQREIGRSNFGAIFVNRQGVGDSAAPSDYNRAYGLDSALQLSQNGKLFSFIARTDSPSAKGGSDYAGRVLYSYANPLVNGTIGYNQVGEHFNPEVGFLPRNGYREPEARIFLTYQPKKESLQWIRRFSPHANYTGYWGFDDELQTSRLHLHYFEIQPSNGGRFGTQLDRYQDQPVVPFLVYAGPDGQRVVIPPGLYTWNQYTTQFLGNPSAPFYFNVQYAIGDFYDGDYWKTDFLVGARVGAKLISSVGYVHENIKLPGGDFTTTLIPVKVAYSFTPLASIQALIQYNSQSFNVSSNIRLALLNRSGTGFFFVYNDRRDTSSFTREANLGRSFIIKYTRLFDF